MRSGPARAGGAAAHPRALLFPGLVRSPRRPRLWLAAALLGALLCVAAASPAPAAAAAARAVSGSPAAGAVTEVVQRPFPLLVPLSYSWARGAAWLNALGAACPRLPVGARRALADAGLDDRAGRLALCGRLYSLDHLTPEDSPEMAVAVRLAPVTDTGEDMQAALTGAARGVELLAVHRALLQDLEQSLLSLQRQWPASLAEARKRAPALDAAAQRLEALWRALGAAQGAPGGWVCAPEALPALERAVNGAPENAALWLLLAEARLQRDLPQGAVEAAGEALGRLGEGSPTAANARLEARARYVRGLGHWRLGQPALAEADLDAALRAGPPESAALGEERARRLRARGAVRLLRRNVDGMCEDFAAACALGDCEGLAVARSRGHCRAGVGATGEGDGGGSSPGSQRVAP